MGFSEQLLGLEMAATATAGGSSLLPREFQYQAAGRPNFDFQSAGQDDLSSLYRHPAPGANADMRAPVSEDQLLTVRSPTSRYPMAPTTTAPLPLLPNTYDGPGDPAWPLKDRMRPDEGIVNPVWLVDRAASGAASMYVAARYVPDLASKLPQGKKWPTRDSLGRLSGDEWKKALPSEVGKVVGWSWLADTALDMTLFNDKTTSWKTVAVDVALPIASKFLIGSLGPIGAIAVSVAGHSAEKYWLEDQC